MPKLKTIHTSRTIMFSEIASLMNHIVEGAEITDLLDLNVFNKRSADNLYKTNKYLQQLYFLNFDQLAFRVFVHYWKITDQAAKPILALLFAVNNDYLLSQSIDVVFNAKLGVKLPIENFDDNIEKYHPSHYSPNTRRSTAQNIASSWKQAGFITGKVKNIRTQPDISYELVAFAMLLSFLNGDRGDFIMHSNCVNALCLSESKLREKAVEASKRDYLQYHYAGNVTSISFDKLINKFGLDAN